MRILPNRKVRTRDTLRGALNLRAEPRGAVSQRCRQCGFMAFRASEQCPVCGLGGWPFAPLHERHGDAHAAQAVPPHGTQQPAPTWSSRVAAAVRNAAIQRPRASSAPLLSILTLVLLVGGYVTLDRTCRADPVCRGQGAPGRVAADASAQAADTPTLPVVPAPVHAFHPADRAPADTNRLADADRPSATDQPGNAGTTRHGTGRATTTLARHAPPLREPESARGGIRVADWKGGVPARRAHAIRRVSVHMRHGRRAAATEAAMAGLYRGH
ncbi:ATP-dependent serine protease [Burkholderia sp. Bp9031]|uniref:ATP-dependent serine protease n=1 Tax=Burkholderia sp. Bp9031 TaxID=2184566 RepID=UPI00158F1B42|nr:ATP-dependent serine protease [Burkholderia sp. Bp9031]